MKIGILVDQQAELEWLRFVLHNFLLTSKANFEFDFGVHPSQSGGIVIAYGLDLDWQNQKVLSIPRRSNCQFGYYVHIVNSACQDNRLGNSLIPILKDTFTERYCSGKPLLKGKGDGSCCASLEGNTINLSFDLLYNCFVHLSCLEEWHHDKDRGPIHSYLNKSKGKNRSQVCQKPIVNYLFAILEDMLLLLTDQLHKDRLFRKREDFQICLTHDVDYIRKTASLRARRSTFYLANGFRDLRKAKFPSALKEMYRSFCFPLTPCDYWQFEYIQELEETYDFRSTFYLYAGVNGGQMTKRFRRLVFDPGYNVEKNGKLQKKIRELTEKGWEVGLHGSFNSYNSPELLSVEKNRLETISGSPVFSTRQHWLHLSLRSTWRIQAEAGIKVDTTLGFNDYIGFRAGIASPFYPYDFDRGRRYQILEVPMVLMDGSLFDHCQMDRNEARKKSFEILEEVKKFNGCVAINWHQRTPAADYKWYWLYHEILTWIRENKGEGMPVSRCVEALDRDEALL